jgi:hypothetical protein
LVNSPVGVLGEILDVDFLGLAGLTILPGDLGLGVRGLKVLLIGECKDRALRESVNGV